VWGTPRQCVDKVMAIRERVGCDSYVGVFSYAGMPYDDAERSMRLFAAKVMPELKKVRCGG
jgi:alkanesulfonate monooxygenase SsuD/methylene tetrahydromethanopterin reductase-like flavin-dependent oxidoreductase (luciferase family)